MLPAMRRIIASAMPPALLVPALLMQALLLPATFGRPARAADGFVGAEIVMALPEDGCQEWGIAGHGWHWGPYWGGADGAAIPAAADDGAGSGTGAGTGAGAENTEGGADGFTTSTVIAPAGLLPCGIAALGGTPIGGTPISGEAAGWTPFGPTLSGSDSLGGAVDTAMTGSVVWLDAAPPPPLAVWPGSLPLGPTADRAAPTRAAGGPGWDDPDADDPDADNPDPRRDPVLTLVTGPPTPVPGIVAAVMPEPRMLLLLGVALAALVLFRRRRA